MWIFPIYNTTWMYYINNSLDYTGAKEKILTWDGKKVQKFYKVYLLKNDLSLNVTVAAKNKSEAKRIAEAQNPGYKHFSLQDMGTVKNQSIKTQEFPIHRRHLS